VIHLQISGQYECKIDTPITSGEDANDEQTLSDEQTLFQMPTIRGRADISVDSECIDMLIQIAQKKFF
jgi:hypothetical protein